MGQDSREGKHVNRGLLIAMHLLILETNGRMEFQPGDRETITCRSLLGMQANWKLGGLKHMAGFPYRHLLD